MSDKSDILLINRYKDFLEAICAYLRHSGYTVHTAMDLTGALNALASYPVGVIICDTALQDIDGYDFLRFLKKDPLRKSIPIVFFAPTTDEGQSLKAIELGATDFLVYPLQVEALINRIWKIMPLEEITERVRTNDDSSDVAPASPSTSADVSTEERRDAQRKDIFPHLRTEISRDGLLWIPGRIKNFSRDGMYVETALLAKQGATMNLRFSTPNGMYIINGFVKHIAFNDIEKPTGIGVSINNSTEWVEVHNYMDSLQGKVSAEAAKKDAANKQSTPSPVTAANPSPRHEVKVLDRSSAVAASQYSDEMSYANRFYQSLIGKQLDNYKVVSFIGSGSMGGVFMGWDIVLEREVALKVISYVLSSQEAYREKFINEARVISKLDHPNIARIYYIGYSSNILYFAMEFIPGNTLQVLIKKQGQIDILKGLDYLITSCQTLDFVCKKNIIHRDIKPDNIIINDKGILKIVDFGVAKTIDLDYKGGKEGKVVGTPFYISPDSIAGGPVDHRSDIYSLGASFYHAFTGYPPFSGKDIKEIILKHLNSKISPMREKNPKVPESLSNIIEKMMAKDPAKRYQDYQELNIDLKLFRSHAWKAQLPNQPASADSPQSDDSITPTD
jgi:CheY-like chemotaxis protein/predicted Ser/Thr protein kinase